MPRKGLNFLVETGLAALERQIGNPAIRSVASKLRRAFHYSRWGRFKQSGKRSFPFIPATPTDGIARH